MWVIFLNITILLGNTNLIIKSSSFKILENQKCPKKNHNIPKMNPQNSKNCIEKTFQTEICNHWIIESVTRIIFSHQLSFIISKKILNPKISWHFSINNICNNDLLYYSIKSVRTIINFQVKSMWSYSTVSLGSIRRQTTVICQMKISIWGYAIANQHWDWSQTHPPIQIIQSIYYN